MGKETDAFRFNVNTFENGQEFELVGMILGLAIYNNIILDIRFPDIYFKKLLDMKLTFGDFRAFDPVFAKGLEQLLEFDGDVENTFCRTFDYEYKTCWDTMQTVELKEGGSNIPVTNENRKEYVELLTEYLMNGSIAESYRMLHSGFHT